MSPRAWSLCMQKNGSSTVEGLMVYEPTLSLASECLKRISVLPAM